MTDLRLTKLSVLMVEYNCTEAEALRIKSTGIAPVVKPKPIMTVTKAPETEIKDTTINTSKFRKSNTKEK